MPDEVSTVEKGVGRPTKYQPEFVRIAKAMCELGATDHELAHEFDCSYATLWHWRARYPEFEEACRLGKAACDDRVEKTLYERACGYNFDSEKVFCTTLRSEVGDDKYSEVEITRVPIREHVPPDTTAAIFWLKNRRPKAWRDRREVTGADGAPIGQLTVINNNMTTNQAAEAYLETLRAIDAGAFDDPEHDPLPQLVAPEPAKETKKAKKPPGEKRKRAPKKNE